MLLYEFNFHNPNYDICSPKTIIFYGNSNIYLDDLDVCRLEPPYMGIRIQLVL